MQEELSLFRLAIALGLMSYAAVLDWRTRRVSNRVWILLGSMAIALLLVEMLFSDIQVDPNQGLAIGSSRPVAFLVLIPICIFFYDVFWDREPVYHKGRWNLLPLAAYAVGFATMAFMVNETGFTRVTMTLLAIPIMIIVFTLFYYARLIHGGADAKALMALAILFPYYPVVNGLPLIENPLDIMSFTFPFAFLILMNAAIIQVAVVPLGLFFKNLAARDFGFPEMFLGCRMDLEEVPKKFVWPMQKVMDGEMVLVLFPKRGGDVKTELEALKDAGADRIWVTPKVPFIIPMLLGIVFSVVVGNLVMLIF